MVRIAIGAVISGVVLMVWGFVFWTVLPWTKCMTRPLPEGEKTAKVLTESIDESGMYFYPMPDEATMSDEDAMNSFLEQHKKGPLVQVIFRKEGLQPMDPAILGMGFAHFIVASILAGVLLTLALPGLQSYLARVLFVFLLGCFATFTINLSNPIWFHHPWSFALFQTSFDLVCWLLAGLVLGAVIKPKE